MTTPPVSFEVKQLLYDKGWRYELGVDETGYRVEHSLAEQRWNEGDLTYLDITIAEVVMWLYEKHEIWISADTIGGEWHWSCYRHESNFETKQLGESDNNVNSPTEAYEAAIEYTLNKLL